MEPIPYEEILEYQQAMAAKYVVDHIFYRHSSASFVFGSSSMYNPTTKRIEVKIWKGEHRNWTWDFDLTNKTIDVSLLMSIANALESWFVNVKEEIARIYNHPY